MYYIDFTKAAEKQLKKLDRNTLQAVSDRISQLSEDPKPPGSKALKGKLA